MKKEKLLKNLKPIFIGMDRTGIIGAMNEEIDLYLKEIKNTKKSELSGFVFYSGKLAETNVVVVKSGAGKVNSAICAQALIDNFKVSEVIFTGVAGALNPNLDVGDIVVSTDAVQHDVDASQLGFERGQIPFTELRFFKTSLELKALALASAEALGLKARGGRILSGDQFISDSEKSKKLREEFNGECVDMESAAVAQACELNDVPHLVIRAISDKADHSAAVDFQEFCRKAAANSFKLVKEVIARMEKVDEEEKHSKIKSMIRTIPHWPKKGIMFRDITTLLKDREGFNSMIDVFVERYADKEIDVIVGIESRGFITGAILANRLGKGFVPIRKLGKLPAETVQEEYELEYGTDKIEVHRDAINKGTKVLLVDDLIATGGTALAACKLITKLGGKVVECSFIVDLQDLGGKKKLEDAGYRAFALVKFEGK